MAQLPPLPTLIAFETVARRRSFARAANDLNLTASAISHQVAKLEAIVGSRLLERTTSAVKLTKAGEFYLQRVGSALAALTAATEDVREGVLKSLYVHASPSLASLWLMPRLAEFTKTHPGVSLSLSASHIHSDFATGQTDIDIRYGTGRWPSLMVKPLFRERVLPLANSETVARLALRSPGDLLSAPLIQSTISIVQWSDFLEQHGVTAAPERFALRFDRAQLALDAAVQGLGIALESSTIAASHIQAGRLVSVFDPSLAVSIEGHFAVYPESHAKRDEVVQFLEWLEEKAAQMLDPFSGVLPANGNAPRPEAL
jgi:DNA-binding transcriptional LysR family regulator